MKARILLVEDNVDLAFGLQNNLEIEGYEVELAADGRTALARVPEIEPDLVVLDLMLPELDGYRVLKELRGDGWQMPVLVLTARGEEADKVQGFRLGADQYVTKPFGLLELLARIERLIARSRSVNGAGPGRTVARIGEIEIDLDARRVLLRGEEVALTPKEFDLLSTLARHRGAAVSRQDLLEEVWGYPSDVLTRTVDTHVAELRRKLEDDPADPRYIVTVRTVGYRLEG